MEKPCILATTLGAPGGIYKCFAPCIEKHFTIIPYEWFVQRKAEFADKIQALFVWGGVIKVDQNLLKSLPNLKAVVNGGVGVDHLDIPLINSFGVKVSNTPHVVDNATADIGMSLMLASARKIVEGESCSFLFRISSWFIILFSESIVNFFFYAGHNFSKFRESDDFPESSLGTDVSGATLGIIGMGRIGYKIAKRAQGFEMKILYHNRNRRPESDERAVGATYCASMKELLQRSDFVMVVVNLSPQTHKLIGPKEFAMMKPNSTFINVSRGLVVDQDALVDALQKKMIRAAALDVTYPEPLPRDHPLLSFPNVIILPHVGTHTVETYQIMVERMVINALAAVTGGQLPDEVKA
uniref:Glyoxylate reductase/hydroxypyruvate reductase n=1 Tax=Cyprinus carpio carpio TaxID=630221 RepID=A0A9J7XAU5_CYPCA